MPSGTRFYGRGAGRMPTASAVVSDIIAVAMGTTPLMFKQLKIFTDTTPPAVVLPMEELKSRYFLRLMVKDQPGVIGAASQILGRHGISIASIQQRESARPTPCRSSSRRTLPEKVRCGRRVAEIAAAGGGQAAGELADHRSAKEFAQA